MTHITHIPIGMKIYVERKKIDMESCQHLDDLLKEQVKIIARHIDKHKWYKGITSQDKAVEDFIDKYAWIMREAYCDLCPTNQACKPYQDYLIINNGGILNGRDRK